MIPSLARLVIGTDPDSTLDGASRDAPPNPLSQQMMSSQSVNVLEERDAESPVIKKWSEASRDIQLLILRALALGVETLKQTDTGSFTNIGVAYHYEKLKVNSSKVGVRFPTKEGNSRTPENNEADTNLMVGVRFPTKEGNTRTPENNEADTKLMVETARLGISPDVYYIVDCKGEETKQWYNEQIHQNKFSQDDEEWAGKLKGKIGDAPPKKSRFKVSDPKPSIVWPYGYVYFVENGTSMHDILLDTRKEESHANIGTQISDVIRLASQNGFIQMDMKPKNLVAFYDAQNELTSVKIIDWDALWCRKYTDFDAHCLEYLQLVLLLWVMKTDYKSAYNGESGKTLRERVLTLNEDKDICQVFWEKKSSEKSVDFCNLAKRDQALEGKDYLLEAAAFEYMLNFYNVTFEHAVQILVEEGQKIIEAEKLP